MKKISLLLVVVLAMGIFLSACTTQEPTTEPQEPATESQDSNTDAAENNDENVPQESEENTVDKAEEDAKAFETVKKIEILDNSFANYGILYDAYLSKVEESYIQGEVPVFTEARHVGFSYVPDVESTKSEEARMAAKEALKTDVKVEASQVFDEESRGWKYIFTKTTVTDSSNEEAPVTFYIYRRYALDNQDGEWKILSIEQFRAEQDTPEDSINFNKYNNEAVEYTQEIPFFQ